MSSVTIGLLGIVIFLILLLLGAPISVGMLVTGVVGYGVITSFPAAVKLISIDMFQSLASYNMSVIAMFTWMGYIAFHAGIGSKLFDVVYKFIGKWPGGLALASEGACALFGAVCGSGAATTATIGAIAFPEMKKRGYDPMLYTASVASGGGLGLLIPPSVTAIVYGVATQQSIGKLFIAGISAGIVLMLLYMLVIFLQVRKNPDLAPRGEDFTWKERLQSLKGGVWETLIIFVFSIGGLSIGWFTPTEGGAIGAFLMLVLAATTKKLSWKSFFASMYDTCKTSGMVLFAIACATIFGRFIAVAQIPAAITRLVEDYNLAPIVVLLIVIVVYLIGGCFIDSLPLIMLTVPIFYPVIIKCGYDPIWFGVICTVVCCIGMITPPVGINAYIANKVDPNVPLQIVFKGCMPFLVAMIVGLVIFIVFPQIITFLPNLVQ